ncbi:MAG TPA: cytochrome c biogenesis protein CcsA [Gemmataceae bacterium]|nr:cytochrome c biogenesis protein CcsA [Gemmataceae bacterium]
MNDFAKVFPWLVVGAATLVLIFTMMPPSAGPAKMNLQEIAGIPVVHDGRMKPLDSVARTTMMTLSNRQEYKDENGKTQPAIKWLLDTMADKESARRVQIFRIEYPPLLDQLGLEARPLWWRYSFDELSKKAGLIVEHAKAADEIKSDKRDIYQQKILELWNHLVVYIQVSRLKAPLMVPPVENGDQWQSLIQALEAEKHGAAPNSAVQSLEAILSAYGQDDVKTFNKVAAAYRKEMEKRFPTETSRTDFEAFFNHFEPFYQCTLLYLAVFLLCILSWFGWSRPLICTAFWLTVLSVLVHTWALLARMYLMNRWGVFVINLYSTAVFIGWACVLLGLFLERLYPIGIGVVVASVGGAGATLVSHHLAASGDTLGVLQAVLDTNFWLATHVTCMNLGYGATFVAGILGIIYLIRGVLTPSLDKSTAKALTTMLYGVICFATLLSFTGTVLGGIWADQSWGRFWGWDPKENGAVLIVIWNALILHARWGGMVQGRGMAVLSVAGNMITGWSYFGTNQLQVGLHSYGFSNTLAFGLVIFWAFHTVVLVAGLLPLHWWASHNALLLGKPRQVEDTPPPAEPPTGKRHGKRGSKRGDAGYFPGPA